jgi:ATP-dependent DNA helicase RecQ
MVWAKTWITTSGAPFRQLVARGYLSVDMEHFGSLRLEEQCRPVGGTAGTAAGTGSGTGRSPYVIFHDRTLQERCTTLPRTPVQFGRITGVGERKLDKYGGNFLQVINEHLVAC